MVHSSLSGRETSKKEFHCFGSVRQVERGSPPMGKLQNLAYQNAEAVSR